MPIVDVQVVYEKNSPLEPSCAQALADSLGRVFGSKPGQNWVRLHPIEVSCYAENDTRLATRELPVFVALLLANPLHGAELLTQAAAVAKAVAACLVRPVERVHVEYAPSGTGRIALGGTLAE